MITAATIRPTKCGEKGVSKTRGATRVLVRSGSGKYSESRKKDKEDVRLGKREWQEEASI